ncbi:MAG: pilus assembly protein N-terminal domain-containing protein [Planctomycetia bacterium]|nr:pilus assembly protein N-terminal domain-containing protein [Planctomycetia bacterium]
MLLNRRLRQLFGTPLAIALLAIWMSWPAPAQAADPEPVVQKIQAGNTRLELTVNTSRILTLDQKIPKVQVGNPEMLDFTALSESQVQIHGKKAGITSVNLWAEDGELHTVDVVVVGDVRELDLVLRQQFPTATVKLFPTTASTLILFGYVDRPDYVSRITDIAKEYFPKVLNNMTVGGSQQVVLHVKVMEVSRTKLRNLGFDFMNFSGADFVGTTPGGLITKASATTSLFRGGGDFTTAGRETFQLGLVNNPSGFVGMLEALKQENVLKVLAEPNIVTVSGRPAYFQVGGQVPYPQPTGFGNISVAFRPFGTQVDFVPIVLGNGNVRLEVKPSVSEIDPTLTVQIAGTAVPGFRTREVDTGVEMKFGQTLALAGLLQQRTQSVRQGIPYVMDIPYLGAAFRRNNNQINEVELLIMVRPELAEGLDPDQVPPCGPGMNTMSPNDCDFYWKGHIEVPVKHPGLMGPSPGDPNQGEPVEPPAASPAAEDMPAAKSPDRSGGTGTLSDRPTSRTSPVALASLPRSNPPSSASPESSNPSDPQARKTRPPTKPNSPQPGFIGPRGYDVKD